MKLIQDLKRLKHRKTCPMYIFELAVFVAVVGWMIAISMILSNLIAGWTANEFIWPTSVVPHYIPKVYAVEKEVIKQPESLDEKLQVAFGDDWQTMKRVAECESSLNPEAKSSISSATGLMQILSQLHGIRADWLVDEDINIAVAQKMYEEQGLKPWEASRHCWDNN